MFKRLVPILALLSVILLLQSVVAHGEGGVSDERFARLAKGVNITRWFSLNSKSDEHYKDYVSDDEMQGIRDTGFTHVRLVIDPWHLWNKDDFSALPSDMLAYIDSAVSRLVAHDLAVIIDMHAPNDFKDHLTTEPDFQAGFAEMWKALAAHFSTTDPEMIFLEVMNEPSPQNLESWPPFQEKLVAAIREGAPEHTIIVGGPNWNSIDGLLMLKPFDDPNIIYNFHFYEPFWFTHQRATWTGTVVEKLHGLTYPSTDGRCGELPDFGDTGANEQADWYCNHDMWDAARIEQRIQQAVDWADQYHVRLTCNEFGVYPIAAPTDDRYQWFSDVRTTFDEHNIGWTLWGYDDSFGFDYAYHGNTMDAKLLDELGMSQK